MSNKLFEDMTTSITNLKSRCKYYDTFDEDVKIIKCMMNNTDKLNVIGECLDKLQTDLNKLYDAVGFNELILDWQVCINQLRNFYNIADPQELIYRNNLDDEYFAQ